MTDSTLEPSRPAPVAEKDRIRNLDMLRGWAVLGILAVNAVAFAWPFLVMMSETLPPIEATHADRVGWWVIDVFFADKMRTLFTMLFGVSVFLVGGERSDLDRGALLRKRLLWLGLFGLIHGLAFWYGDILLHYAYCGFIFLMFRSWSARRLLWVGGGITVFWALVASASYWGMANLPPEFAAKMTQGRPEVSPETVQAVVDAYLGGYVGVLTQNGQAWLMSALFFPRFGLDHRRRRCGRPGRADDPGRRGRRRDRSDRCRTGRAGRRAVAGRSGSRSGRPGPGNHAGEPGSGPGQLTVGGGFIPAFRSRPQSLLSSAARIAARVVTRG
jgi:hypothetical protein